MNFRTLSKGKTFDQVTAGAGQTFLTNTLTPDAGDFGTPGKVLIYRSENDDVRGVVKGTRQYPGKAVENISVGPGGLLLACSHGVPNTPASPTVADGLPTFTLEKAVHIFKQ